MFQKKKKTKPCNARSVKDVISKRKKQRGLRDLGGTESSNEFLHQEVANIFITSLAKIQKKKKD